MDRYRSTPKLGEKAELSPTASRKFKKDLKAKHVAKRRECLGCGRKMMSEWIGHRICRACDKRNSSRQDDPLNTLPDSC